MYHTTLDSKVIKKKEKVQRSADGEDDVRTNNVLRKSDLRRNDLAQNDLSTAQAWGACNVRSTLHGGVGQRAHEDVTRT